ncbi:MAG: GTPase domain-containing protein [Pirellulales bacterium]|nr:GTPase domain-containing protein [Pirellulales bacterium]
MTSPELAHLELLAEVDATVAELRAWADSTPDWPPARAAQSLLSRLVVRSESLRIRLEAPLVVATLGGTGTGKSTLVNALAGEEVTSSGKERPTTRMPKLVCRPDISPESLGLPANVAHVHHCESPTLRDLVLLDCPDPDTTEDVEASATNLDRLRHLLPHCDVLLVTGTQQKYRSARVNKELARAASGAKIVFVQTHADTDADVREDWRAHLTDEYQVGEMFFVDSVQALKDAQSEIAPRGEFARLTDFLNRELSRSTANRIRRANFLELVQETLAACENKIKVGQAAIDSLDAAITENRGRLSSRLIVQLCEELLVSRRQWESRLLGEVTSRFGFSPFSLVLRAYHGFGGLMASAALTRVRTPGQLALWGAWQAGRKLRGSKKTKEAVEAMEETVAWSWDEAELRTAAIIVSGHAQEAGLSTDELRVETFQESAADAGASFVKRASGQLQDVVKRLAGKHTHWWTRVRYEVLLLAMLGLIVFHLGKNFFWLNLIGPMVGRVDVETAPPIEGLPFFLQAAFWLLVWSMLLVWMFLSRLRRGLKREINTLADRWNTEAPATGLFTGLENRILGIKQFSARLERLQLSVDELLGKVTQPASGLTWRKEESPAGS